MSHQNDHALAGVPLPKEWSPIHEGLWWRLAGGQPQFAPPEEAGADPSSA
jgi:hypothetical protein